MPFCMIEFLRPRRILRGARHHGAALTSSSISAACSSPHQMPAPLHKVEEGRCHSLNRIYGLSLRHKLDSKYITVEVASSTATCLYLPLCQSQHCRTIRRKRLARQQNMHICIRSPKHLSPILDWGIKKVTPMLFFKGSEKSKFAILFSKSELCFFFKAIRIVLFF